MVLVLGAAIGAGVAAAAPQEGKGKVAPVPRDALDHLHGNDWSILDAENRTHVSLSLTTGKDDIASKGAFKIDGKPSEGSFGLTVSSMPGNVFRIFEKGQADQLQLGVPTLDEPPGKPEKRLSPRGLGTLNRVDPTILGAQPASVKVGLIHPVTGFVAYNGQQSRLGATMAVEDVNKAGGIKGMGGAKLEALLGDSQSKVEVGVSEVEKMNEQGVAAYIGCFQSPVTIAATQAAAKYGTPFLVDVASSDVIVNRGLKNTFRLMPGFGVCVDQGIASLGALNKAAGGVAKSAVIVHESGEFGTGTAKLLASKLPSIGIEAKEVIGHDNPTRNFDNIALRIRSLAPDIIMMSNYGNEYMLLARTLYQQKVNVAGFFSVLGGGFNYKFVKEMPDVSQYMMDVNHWFNPKSEKAQALIEKIVKMAKPRLYILTRP